MSDGPLLTPMEFLRASLAASTTFQTLAGISTSAAAAQRIRFFAFDHPRGWAAQKYAVPGGQFHFVIPTAGLGAFIYECTTAGTTDATTEPTWPTTAGATVGDGGAVWTARALLVERNADDAALQTAIRSARPFALVGIGGEYKVVISGMGSPAQFSANGDLLLFLEGDVPSEHADSLSDALAWWATTAGGVLNDLLAQAFTAGKLSITGVELTQFARSSPREQNLFGDCCQAEFRIRWKGRP